MVRIFVVEDSTLIRARLRAMLGLQAEWKVVGEARNGRHAVETCHEHRPHINVMDFVMPEMDGLEAARQASAPVGQKRQTAKAEQKRQWNENPETDTHKSALTSLIAAKKKIRAIRRKEVRQGKKRRAQPRTESDLAPHLLFALL